MKPAISVSHLAKRFRLGDGSDYRTLRETLMDLASASVRGIRDGARSLLRMTRATDALPQRKSDEIWALNDVSFDVRPGEVLGVIGRNGAGKSTLLKVLSRITYPTSGQIDLHGRVGSLLEVGTGFHPELTGRENVYLNGAILGMTRREIARKFGEIVAFAEIDRFLDTPVKRYSSGMYTRLAFAVASHLEPEILLVDEVLAVGDTSFQKKCLGKMDQVSRDGRTILFVSHNMAAVKTLCSRAILVEKGRIARDGPVDDVVNAYLAADTDMPHTGIIPDDAPRKSNGEARFRSVKIVGPDGGRATQTYFGQPFRITFVCDVFKDIRDALFEITISMLDGTPVAVTGTLDGGNDARPLPCGQYEVSVDIDLMLLPRTYTIDLGLHHSDSVAADLVHRVLDFTVLKVAESGNDHYRWPSVRGFVRPGAKWSIQPAAPVQPAAT